MLDGVPYPTYRLRDSRKMKTILANVDMELYSKQSLKEVAEALDEKLYTMYQGKSGDGYMYSAEISIGGGADSVEEIIDSFLQLLSAISNKEILENCTKKIFNIGIEAGTKPQFSEYRLPQKILKAASEAGFSITVTVYSYDDKQMEA